MDWRTLNHDYLMAAIAGGAFLLGVLLTALARSGKSASLSEDPRNNQIRQLEADMRVNERRLKEVVEKLDSRNNEYDDSVGTVHDLEAVLAEREGEVEKFRQEVHAAVKKTQELRLELTDRAAETIREKVKVKEYETELDVVKAGSQVMAGEFARLQNADGTDEHAEGSDIDDLLDDDALLGGAPTT
jgi:chromosome segregation ATPase